MHAYINNIEQVNNIYKTRNSNHVCIERRKGERYIGIRTQCFKIIGNVYFQYQSEVVCPQKLYLNFYGYDIFCSLKTLWSLLFLFFYTLLSQ